MGIYKRKQESKKTRKHAFDQESDEEKQERIHAPVQESDQEKTITVKKEEYQYQSYFQPLIIVSFIGRTDQLNQIEYTYFDCDV